MNDDRIHAREPEMDRERWREGVVRSVETRDGHAVFAIEADGETVELTVTTAIRDLVVGRLDVEPGESPVGERVWFRRRGG